jgi:hypothetical protein
MGQGQHYRLSAKSEIQHGRHRAIFMKSEASLSNLPHILHAYAIAQGQYAHRFWHRSKMAAMADFVCCIPYEA